MLGVLGRLGRKDKETEVLARGVRLSHLIDMLTKAYKAHGDLPVFVHPGELEPSKCEIIGIVTNDAGSGADDFEPQNLFLMTPAGVDFVKARGGFEAGPEL